MWNDDLRSRPFAYFWLNTDPNNGNAVITTMVTVAGANANYIQANREFYQQGSSFTGATGVGAGVTASRPGTCTTGVAYWETDNQQLDECTATNTWATGVYVPYTYPDPLQGGSVTASQIGTGAKLLSGASIAQ